MATEGKASFAGTCDQTDDIFEMITSIDATTPPSRETSFNLEELIGGTTSEMDLWGALTSFDEGGVADGPADEPAKFVVHINSTMQHSEPSCESPTQVTAPLSILETPIPKRSKPKAFRTANKSKTLQCNSVQARDDASLDDVDVAAGCSAEQAPASPPLEDKTDASTSLDKTTASTSSAEESEASDPPAATEMKRMQRMQRNRESAAESRKRKKQRVEEYEALVASLQETVEKLKQQNDELRRANAIAASKQETGSCGTALPTPPLPLVNSAACA